MISSVQMLLIKLLFRIIPDIPHILHQGEAGWTCLPHLAKILGLITEDLAHGIYGIIPLYTWNIPGIYTEYTRNIPGIYLEYCILAHNISELGSIIYLVFHLVDVLLATHFFRKACSI